jgi:hypothetical protein
MSEIVPETLKNIPDYYYQIIQFFVHELNIVI